MTEFALVAPLLLVALFGILDGSLMIFTVGTARYAAAEGARVAAQMGAASTADSVAVSTITQGPLSRTRLATVLHIDIYRMIQESDGQLTVDGSNYDSYRPDGSIISSTWPPSARNTQNGLSDFLGLTVYYNYGWRSGALLGTGALQLTQAFYVRIEPDTY
jgi:hypothetical protein